MLLLAAVLLAACAGAAHPHVAAARGPRGRRYFFAGGGFVAFVPGALGRGGRPAITVPAIPPARSPLVISMPLESYEETASAQQDVLAAASSALLQRCMAQRGFLYRAAASSENGLASLQALEQAPIGLTSLSQAQSFGFVRPKGQAGGAGFAPFATIYGTAFFKMINSEGRAWTAAMFGFVPGSPSSAGQLGCMEATQRELFGNGGPGIDPMIQLAALAENWARSDPRVLAVDRAWSACMRRHGFGYGSPTAAEQRRWPNPPDKAEIAVAVADVNCKIATNLVNTWLAVEAGYQQAIIAQNATTLADLQARFARELRNVEALLSNGG